MNIICKINAEKKDAEISSELIIRIYTLFLTSKVHVGKNDVFTKKNTILTIHVKFMFKKIIPL